MRSPQANIWRQFALTTVELRSPQPYSELFRRHFQSQRGAAIGREGSMIQFAAAANSWMTMRSPFKTASLSQQVACGAAAAVCQAFLAGVFFALEIVLGKWSWSDIPQLALGQITYLRSVRSCQLLTMPVDSRMMSSVEMRCSVPWLPRRWFAA
jgi:hypothetical protein